jgi:hypothetical protein
MRRQVLAFALIAAGLLAPSRSQAQSLEFQGSGNTPATSHLNAEALFEVEPGFLKITVVNTASSDVLVPTDVLTGIFFQFSGAPLTKSSATVAPGSAVSGVAPPAGFAGNIGGEWGFKSGLQSDPTNYGISAVGLDDTFGPGDRFGGPNYSGPPSGSLGTIDWGLASKGDNPATGNGGISGQPLVKNGAIFRLAGLPIGFTLTEGGIQNVRFHYGSSGSGPDYPGELVPEPGTLSILGLAVAPLLRRRLRRRRSA